MNLRHLFHSNTAVPLKEIEEINFPFKIGKGRYGLISVIGEGGYAKVWKAFDFKKCQYCAVKDFSCPFAGFHTEQVINTYRLIRRLKHPNLVHISNCIIENGVPYVIMSYYTCGSLADIKKKHFLLSEQKLWRMITDVASGLKYLHDRHIVHQDIKPANIMFDAQSGGYLIADFDNIQFPKSTIYECKTFSFGPYKAPERHFSPKKALPSSDIWSFGATIYEMATGKIPFGIRGGLEQLDSGNHYVKHIDGFQQKLNDLVSACLNLFPENRPSAKEIIAYTNGEKQDSIPDSTTPQLIINDDALSHPHHLHFLDDLKVVKDNNTGLYGVTDNHGKVLVDFIYDSIEKFGFAEWPGHPGQYHANELFLGAFFKQGDDVGYLYVLDDGSVKEYKRCSQGAFQNLSILT